MNPREMRPRIERKFDRPARTFSINDIPISQFHCKCFLFAVTRARVEFAFYDDIIVQAARNSHSYVI